MSDIKLDDLEPTVVDGLSERARSHGRTVQEEAEAIIREAVAPLPERLGSRIRARFAPLGGVVLNLPPRPSTRTLPFVYDDD